MHSYPQTLPGSGRSALPAAGALSVHRSVSPCTLPPGPPARGRRRPPPSALGHPLLPAPLARPSPQPRGALSTHPLRSGPAARRTKLKAGGERQGQCWEPAAAAGKSRGFEVPLPAGARAGRGRTAAPALPTLCAPTQARPPVATRRQGRARARGGGQGAAGGPQAEFASPRRRGQGGKEETVAVQETEPSGPGSCPAMLPRMKRGEKGVTAITGLIN